VARTGGQFSFEKFGRENGRIRFGPVVVRIKEMTDLPRMVRERAYARWTRDEDELLRSRYLNGRHFTDLARLHGREPMAIRARLIELGVLNEPPGAGPS
jgi:hypothetical protein